MADISASAGSLAGRYASALFELARDRDALDPVASDLEGLAALIAESADLRRVIESPALSRDQQTRAIDAIAERGGCHDLTRRFLGVLAENRRLFALPDVVRAYRAMLALHRGEISAELVSAVPLSDDQVASLKDEMSKAVGQTVNVTTRVDPNLIGGLLVRVGSRMIDASLRNKLHQLELAMRGVA